MANNNKYGNTIIIFFILDIAATNSAKICTNVCPAIILADNLIAKLNDLIIYDNISIVIIKGYKAKGTSGTNNFKNFTPWLKIPKKNIPKHILKEKNNVQNRWLVTAKAKGNILNKFKSKIKLNKANKNGKYINPTWPICSVTILNATK